MVTIILLIFSAAFRAIQEHGKWRNSAEWSVLYGTWWLRTDHPLNLDGYHVSSSLHVWLVLFAGFFWQWSLWWVPVAWIAFYQVNNFFYHVVFTVPERRDWQLFGYEKKSAIHIDDI